MIYDIIIFCKDSISNINKENIHYKKAYKTYKNRSCETRYYLNLKGKNKHIGGETCL